MGVPTPVAEVTAFHVLGALFAAWAVTVAFLGITREGFPSRGVQARLVGAISVLLALGAIGSAIIVAALEERKEEKEAAEAKAAEAKAAPAATGGVRLALTADPGGMLRFDRRSLRAKAGSVTVAMRNPSLLTHNVAIEGGGVEESGKLVGKGGTSTVTAELRPGEYTFYCSVDGHRRAGMEGTLTVR